MPCLTTARPHDKMGGMSRKPVSSMVLLALIVAGLVLPITICVVLVLAFAAGCHGRSRGGDGLALRGPGRRGRLDRGAGRPGLRSGDPHVWAGRTMPISSRWRLWQCKAARIVPSSGFPTPSWKAVVELRVPEPATLAADSRALRQDPPSPPHALRRGGARTRRSPQPPSAWAISPAAAAGRPPARTDGDVQMRVVVEGKVSLVLRTGEAGRRGGRRRLSLPAGKAARQAAADCRPAARRSAAGARAMPRCSRWPSSAAPWPGPMPPATSRFLFPAAESYRILVLSAHGAA